MLLPCVSNTGYRAPRGAFENCFSLPSATETDQMPESDPRRAKTIDLPSGDQLGKLSRASGSCGVSSRGAPPFVETIQIVDIFGGDKSIGTSVKIGAERNTMVLPSGDHAGCEPKSVSFLAVPPSAGTMKIPLLT